MLKRLTKLPPSIDAEVGADLLHAEAHRRDLVAIDDDLGSWPGRSCTSMIGGKANCPLFTASCTSCLREAEQLLVARPSTR